MNADDVLNLYPQKPFGPLNMSETFETMTDNSCTCKCILCDLEFCMPGEQTPMLTHFYTNHRLVIADIHLIPDLKAYVDFWKEEFVGHNLAEFCTTMLLDQIPDGTFSKNEKYYLLSEVLPKDYELRAKLQKKKYEEVLDLYQMERSKTDFSKECLFCRRIISGTRISFIGHLFEKHNLYLGRYSNLVYIEDMIRLLQFKIEQFICIFCEKIFKDRTTLKEHMRKKNHKRINPKNKEFDRFYLINYNYFLKQNKNIVPTIEKESLKSGEQLNPESEISKSDKEDDRNSVSEDSNWCDWEGSPLDIMCLFCNHKDTEFSVLLQHMENRHGFNFESAVSEFEFYKKVKLVNYIRRKIYLNECIMCDKKFDNKKLQQDHLKAENHIGIADKKYWDHPEYFFPTFEDDDFLCYLDNDWNDCCTENV